jgi:DNA-binding NarL/FixJ family response regulator
MYSVRHVLGFAPSPPANPMPTPNLLVFPAGSAVITSLRIYFAASRFAVHVVEAANRDRALALLSAPPPGIAALLVDLGGTSGPAAIQLVAAMRHAVPPIPVPVVAVAAALTASLRSACTHLDILLLQVQHAQTEDLRMLARKVAEQMLIRTFGPARGTPPQGSLLLPGFDGEDA